MRAWVVSLLFSVLFICLGACDRPADVLEEGSLVVAIRQSPITYSLDADGKPTGFEYDLVAQFAREAGLRLSLLVLPSDQEMLRHLESGKAHLAVGWLSPPQTRPERFRIGRPYFRSQLAVVQHEAGLLLETEEELAERPLYVAAGSHLAERLYRLREKMPKLQIVERPDADGLGHLRDVAEQKIELTVVDEPLFDIAQNFFPELQSPTLLGAPQPISWLFAAEGHDDIFDKAQRFIAGAESSGTLARLRDRYLGHVHRLSSAAIIDFLARTRTVLPKYQGLFKQAQIRSGIDWRMIAALAYQESKWDPLATSRTNVRGMMMLTEDTADRLRVSDRLDPRQSIFAGAEYLADLRDALPASIHEPDRTWMALAAYNMGMGHMNGARQIAQGMKVDVDQWHRMKKVLPLMARPEYYSRLKSGRARGGEAVIMVENIRAYYDILQRFLPGYDPLTRGDDDAAGNSRSGGATAKGPQPGTNEGPGLKPPRR